jgi:hypothetical protein
MYPKRCSKITALGLVLALGQWSVLAQTPDQTPAKPVIDQGEVTGNDVYVRSGDSLNHYPVCKVRAGDRVDIVGERGDWYEILPPEGTFSLVSGDFVDTEDGKSGVVNGENVRVRAGSSLNDNKYAVQTLLSKGAEVTILERNPDGFLRIKPPPGATLWINRAYVERGSERSARPAVEASTGGPDAGRTEKGSPAAAGTFGYPGDAASRSALASLEPTEQRRQLQELDAASAAEFAKPLFERQLEPLVKRYRDLAAQQEDQFAARYAEARIEQLKSGAAMVDAVRLVRALTGDVDTVRREFLEKRANIRDVMFPVPTALDAQGELRVSAVYSSDALPRRYRLVDTMGGRDRTIGYVEIPRDSSINVDEFLGRYVGVRASAKRLQPGGVNPVPILVASELVLLQPIATPTGESSERK